MESQDETMTAIILRLLRQRLIVFSKCLKSGILIPVLSIRGMAVGELIGSLIQDITNGANWNALCNCSDWKEVVLTVLSIAKNWVIKNVEMMIELALRIASFIANLFNNQSHVSPLKELPAPELENKSKIN